METLGFIYLKMITMERQAVHFGIQIAAIYFACLYFTSNDFIQVQYSFSVLQTYKQAHLITFPLLLSKA